MSCAVGAPESRGRHGAFAAALLLPPALLALLAATGMAPWAAGRGALAPSLWLQLALLYPLLEELVFRGLIQGSLLRRAWAGRQWRGVSLANLATSVLFAAAHLLAHAPAWAAAVLLPSLLFGYFRERYQSLLPPLLLHISYNAAFFLS